MASRLPVNRFTQRLAKFYLWLLRWKIDYQPPLCDKYVVIGAPHTSNLDFLFTLLFMHAAGLQLHWVGKDTLFWGPLGPIFRWLGGIPVNRRSSTNFVQQIVDVFNQREHFVVAIAPEGTRKNVEYWKTGFYYIAAGAHVPIALGYIDYPSKTVGIGDSLMPTGDLDVDFPKIQAFYADKRGRHPHKQGEVKLRPTSN